MGRCSVLKMTLVFVHSKRLLVVATITASALMPAPGSRRRLGSTSNRCAALASTPVDDEDDDGHIASQKQLDAVAVKTTSLSGS